MRIIANAGVRLPESLFFKPWLLLLNNKSAPDKGLLFALKNAKKRKGKRIESCFIFQDLE
jgi:hypothetical protein